MEKYLQEFKYYLHGELNLALSTVKSYMNDLQLYINFIQTYRKKKYPEDIETEDVRAYLDSLKRKYITASSQARKLTAIRSFHKFMLLEKYTSKDVAYVIQNPKQELKLPSFLSKQEINMLFSVLEYDNPTNIRNSAMIVLLYACGLRVGELTNLKTSDLHFNQGFINVIGKGDKERVVPINEEAIRIINIYLESSRPVLRKDKTKNELFLNSKGGGISRNTVYTVLKAKGIEAGIRKSLYPHILRHSFASHLLEEGLDLRLIQELLGHEDIMTTEVYTHVRNTHLQEVYLKAHPRARKGNNNE